MGSRNLYADRDPIELGKFYTDHVSAMTREGLHAKSAIAGELAWRDNLIVELCVRAERAEKIADLMCKEALVSNCRWIFGDGEHWINIDTADGIEFAEELAYLDSRGLLIRHPDHPQLVRLEGDE